jgi:hypothetical protein
MQSLLVDVAVTVRGRVSAATGCAVNKGSPIAALILHNGHTQPAQTLFYQVILRPFCPGEPSYDHPCSTQRRRLEPFAQTNPFGVNDYITRLGQEYLPLGITRHLRVDLLPALEQALASTSRSLDSDPSHWIVDDVYLGQIVFGDVVLQSDWQGFRLEAVTR